MNFLCLEEQAKVKRLIEQYQSSAKDADTQSNASHPKEDCKCLDKIMAELQHIKVMIKDGRAITSMPSTSPSCNNTPDLSNNSETDIVELSGSDDYFSLPSPLTSTSTSNLESTNSSYLSESTDMEKCSPYLVKPSWPKVSIDETFKRSSSMPNYAKNLFFQLFQQEELVGANCAGVLGKRGLEKDNRMNIVKESTFKKYSVDDRYKSWSLCRKAIDSAIIKLKK